MTKFYIDSRDEELSEATESLLMGAINAHLDLRGGAFPSFGYRVSHVTLDDGVFSPFLRLTIAPYRWRRMAFEIPFGGLVAFPLEETVSDLTLYEASRNDDEDEHEPWVLEQDPLPLYISIEEAAETIRYQIRAVVRMEIMRELATRRPRFRDAIFTLVGGRTEMAGAVRTRVSDLPFSIVSTAMELAGLGLCRFNDVFFYANDNTRRARKVLEALEAAPLSWKTMLFDDPASYIWF